MFQYFPVADVNTCVLTDEDCMLMEEVSKKNHPDAVIHVVANYEYGWIISLQGEDEEFEEMLDYAVKRGFSYKFTRLMRSLKAYGFHYVRLDTDGLTDETPEPPKTMWEHMEAERIRKSGRGT